MTSRHADWLRQSRSDCFIITLIVILWVLVTQTIAHALLGDAALGNGTNRIGPLQATLRWSLIGLPVALVVHSFFLLIAFVLRLPLRWWWHAIALILLGSPITIAASMSVLRDMDMWDLLSYAAGFGLLLPTSGLVLAWCLTLVVGACACIRSRTCEASVSR